MFYPLLIGPTTTIFWWWQTTTATLPPPQAAALWWLVSDDTESRERETERERTGVDSDRWYSSRTGGPSFRPSGFTMTLKTMTENG
ncbi:hypothetical protein HanXRQr2_Chr04g0192521 [Helianthus annuus]|uniref:Secreted protein n=1 Tax=Helianthus annuus TaxID=4232 RepID=A0A251TQP2_HELAN|nr:hypothetical protein HanXRQr2_Chr04g0192521 [Helianthus annuus]KAJ0598973.1 hypothetical protein HanHA89_Chr04g0171601 [Helianthus annuus]